MPGITLRVAIAVMVLTTSAKADDRPPDKPTTGTIRGRLSWAGESIPVAETYLPSASALFRCEPKPRSLRRRWIIDPATKGIAGGVAYLIRPQEDFAEYETAWLARNPEVTIGQTNCEIVPFLAIVHRQQNLRFKMDQLEGHSLDVKNDSLVGKMMPPAVPAQHSAVLSRDVRSSKMGRPDHIVCDIHPWMDGDVLPIDHPFAALTQVDGSFEIPHVPAGEQRLIVWHPQRGYVTAGSVKGQAVVVQAGAATDVGALTMQLEPNR